jgi:hypothetical protein
MSTRRSGRATKEVKYTSASEGSDFEDKKKKTRKTATSKKAATPKKTTKKRAAEFDDDEALTNGSSATAATTPSKPKRQKKDPATLAAEAREKQAKADKAAHKKAWQDWLSTHDVESERLEEEPAKEESITQTDALKKYGVKKEELSSLLRFEKKNPLYGGTMKLFLEANVRELAFRKISMLDGCEGDDEQVVKRGEEMWREEHKDDVDVPEEKPNKNETKDKPTPTKEKPKEYLRPKQKWNEYISTHAIDENDKLTEEPADIINQTKCKSKYFLTQKDLACLRQFPKKNPTSRFNTKLFKESEVKLLAYRKTAVLAGVDDGKDDGALLERGRELFEAQDGSDEDVEVDGV